MEDKGSKGDCDYVRRLVANRSWRGLYAVPSVMLEATGPDGPGTGGFLSGDLLAKVFSRAYCQWGSVWTPGEVVSGYSKGFWLCTVVILGGQKISVRSRECYTVFGWYLSSCGVVIGVVCLTYLLGTGGAMYPLRLYRCYAKVPEPMSSYCSR